MQQQSAEAKIQTSFVKSLSSSQKTTNKTICSSGCNWFTEDCISLPYANQVAPFSYTKYGHEIEGITKVNCSELEETNPIALRV